MHVLRSSNARIIVRDAEVWPIFGRKYGRESSRVSRADKSRYFGRTEKERQRGQKENARERGGGEGLVVISLVKAGLLCEFLISVHLPVIPHTVYNIEHTCCHPYMRMHIPEGNRMREAEQDRKRLIFILRQGP